MVQIVRLKRAKDGLVLLAKLASQGKTKPGGEPITTQSIQKLKASGGGGVSSAARAVDASLDEAIRAGANMFLAVEALGLVQERLGIDPNAPDFEAALDLRLQQLQQLKRSTDELQQLKVQFAASQSEASKVPLLQRQLQAQKESAQNSGQRSQELERKLAHVQQGLDRLQPQQEALQALLKALGLAPHLFPAQIRAKASELDFHRLRLRQLTNLESVDPQLVVLMEMLDMNTGVRVKLEEIFRALDPNADYPKAIEDLFREIGEKIKALRKRNEDLVAQVGDVNALALERAEKEGLAAQLAEITAGIVQIVNELGEGKVLFDTKNSDEALAALRTGLVEQKEHLEALVQVQRGKTRVPLEIDKGWQLPDPALHPGGQPAAVDTVQPAVLGAGRGQTQGVTPPPAAKPEPVAPSVGPAAAGAKPKAAPAALFSTYTPGKPVIISGDAPEDIVGPNFVLRTGKAGRDHNEDTLGYMLLHQTPSGNHDVYAVADGAGGGVASKEASKLAVDTYMTSRSTKRDMAQSVLDAHIAVLAYKRTHSIRSDQTMASTLTVLEIDRERSFVHVVHVGDSEFGVLDAEGKASIVTRPHKLLFKESSIGGIKAIAMDGNLPEGFREAVETVGLQVRFDGTRTIPALSIQQADAIGKVAGKLSHHKNAVMSQQINLKSAIGSEENTTELRVDIYSISIDPSMAGVLGFLTSDGITSRMSHSDFVRLITGASSRDPQAVVNHVWANMGNPSDNVSLGFVALPGIDLGRMSARTTIFDPKIIENELARVMKPEALPEDGGAPGQGNAGSGGQGKGSAGNGGNGTGGSRDRQKSQKTDSAQVLRRNLPPLRVDFIWNGETEERINTGMRDRIARDVSMNFAHFQEASAESIEIIIMDSLPISRVNNEGRDIPKIVRSYQRKERNSGFNHRVYLYVDEHDEIGASFDYQPLTLTQLE